MILNLYYPGMVGGFLPGVKQIANVAALPGIVGKSVGLPDIHSGMDFLIYVWNCCQFFSAHLPT